MNSFELLSVHDDENRQCLEDNIEFVMLNEILRARSHELVELLSVDSPDLQQVKRHALNIKLSTQSLIREEVLVNPRFTKDLGNVSDAHEPASLQSIIDLALIAVRHRLAEMKISFHPPVRECDELFILGNAYEIAYAAFLLCMRSGLALSRTPPQGKLSTGLQMHLSIEADFADIVISSPVPLVPSENRSENSELFPHLLSNREWFCLQKLLSRNNTHVHIETSEDERIGKYSIILRLPTFHPGHEEPLDFLTKSDAP